MDSLRHPKVSISMKSLIHTQNFIGCLVKLSSKFSHIYVGVITYSWHKLNAGTTNQLQCTSRDYSVYAPRQWDMAFQRNAISDWLDACTEWSLCQWYSQFLLSYLILSYRKRGPQQWSHQCFSWGPLQWQDYRHKQWLNIENEGQHGMWSFLQISQTGG